MLRAQKEGNSAPKPFTGGRGGSSVAIFLNAFLDFSVINHGHIVNAMYPNTVDFFLTVCCVYNCDKCF